MHLHNVKQEKVRLCVPSSDEFRHQRLIPSSNRAKTVLSLKCQPYVEVMDQFLDVYQVPFVANTEYAL